MNEWKRTAEEFPSVNYRPASWLLPQAAQKFYHPSRITDSGGTPAGLSDPVKSSCLLTLIMVKGNLDARVAVVQQVPPSRSPPHHKVPTTPETKPCKTVIFARHRIRYKHKRQTYSGRSTVPLNKNCQSAIGHLSWGREPKTRVAKSTRFPPERSALESSTPIHPLKPGLDQNSTVQGQGTRKPTKPNSKPCTHLDAPKLVLNPQAKTTSCPKTPFTPLVLQSKSVRGIQ